MPGTEQSDRRSRAIDSLFPGTARFTHAPGLVSTLGMPKNKLLQYLNEARASEVGLVRVLQSQIAMTPRRCYRAGLEKHLEETRGHAGGRRGRLRELDSSG